MVGVTIVLVVAISLVTHLWADDRSRSSGDDDRPLVEAVTGTTDELTAGESSTQPTVAPAPGHIQPSQQDWEALLPRLVEVADADPDDVNARRKLALAYYNLGLYEEAKAIYEALLAAHEDSVLRNRLGNTLRDIGDLQGAETAYRKAIEDDPAIAPHYLNLAELLWRQGRDEEALAILDRGLGAVALEDRASLEAGRRVLVDSQREPD